MHWTNSLSRKSSHIRFQTLFLTMLRLQSVMVNRLVLNLKHGANAREDSEFRTRTGLEPPAFASGPFLGSIGGPVRTMPDDFDNDFKDDMLDDHDKVVNDTSTSSSSDCFEDDNCSTETAHDFNLGEPPPGKMEV